MALLLQVRFSWILHSSLLILVSVPVAALIGIFAMLAIPRPQMPPSSISRTLACSDIPGVTIFTACSVLLVTALQEGGISLAWGSIGQAIILSVAALCLVIFLSYECIAHIRNLPTTLPIVSLKHRTSAFSLLYVFKRLTATLPY